MADPDYMMAQFLECTVHDFEVVLPPEHTHWQNAAGNRVPIVRMSRPHLLNTLRFCERKNRPNGPGTIFWALRREAERRGYRPTEEEWTEARRRADRAGVPDTAGYWEIWVGYGFFSRDGNPVREAEEAEDAELSYSIRYREWEAIPTMPDEECDDCSCEYYPIDSEDF